MIAILPIAWASLLSLVGFCVAYAIYKELTTATHLTDDSLQELSSCRSKLELMSKELESVRAKAHTHSTIAGIEDTSAIAIDVTIGLEVLLARMDTLRTKLGVIRQSPYAYDGETPAGRRTRRRLSV